MAFQDHRGHVLATDPAGPRHWGLRDGVTVSSASGTCLVPGGGGAHAGQRAPHACPSRYAHAAMWRQFPQLYPMHPAPMKLHVLVLAVLCQPQPLACMFRTWVTSTLPSQGGGSFKWSGCNVRIGLWLRLPHGCHRLLALLWASYDCAFSSPCFHAVLWPLGLRGGGGGGGGGRVNFKTHPPRIWENPGTQVPPPRGCRGGGGWPRTHPPRQPPKPDKKHEHCTRFQKLLKQDEQMSRTGPTDNRKRKDRTKHTLFSIGESPRGDEQDNL